MAYYKKQEIVEFVNSSFKLVQENKHTPITDPQKPLKELTDESDLVGFFWLELTPNGENGVGIKMEGKVFVRLDYDIYTDDRFALDSYHATQEGVSTLDIIRKREEEKSTAKQQISPEVLESLKGFISNPSNTK